MCILICCLAKPARPVGPGEILRGGGTAVSWADFVGGAVAHYRADPGSFYGFQLEQLFPAI